MSKIIVWAAGGYVIADIASGGKIQYEANKQQADIIEANTELINAEIEYNNQVLGIIEKEKEREKNLRNVAVDEMFEKILQGEIDIKDIKDVALKQKIQEFLNGKRSIKSEIEIKEMLQDYIKQTEEEDKIKAKINAELLMMQKIVSKTSGGKDKVEAKFDNGKVIIVIPETMVKKAVEEYKTKEQAKKGFVSYGGRHRTELMEYISEYAELRISNKDIQLKLEATILRKVLNEMTVSSYRPDEADRNTRYRDPRKESILKDNDITEEKVEQTIQRRVDMQNIERVDESDISKIAEYMFNEDIKEKDSISTEQRKEILEAIEGKLQDKVAEMKLQKKLSDLTENEYISQRNDDIKVDISKEKQKEIENAIVSAFSDTSKEAGEVLKGRLDAIMSDSEVTRAMQSLSEKDLIRLISGKTEVEIPDRLYGLVNSSQNLQQARANLRQIKPDMNYRYSDVNGLVSQISGSK